MSFRSIHVGLKTIAILFAAGLAVAQGTSAQYQQQPQQQQPQPQPQQQQPTPAPSGKAAPLSAPQAPAEAPKIDPEEEKAYKAFVDANAPQQADARIKLGEQFVEMCIRDSLLCARRSHKTVSYSTLAKIKPPEPI